MYKKELNEISAFILKAKNIDEIKDFLYRFFTDSEIENFSKRWRILKLLLKHKTIKEIAEITETSTTTISKINQKFKYKSNYLNNLLKRFFKL